MRLWRNPQNGHHHATPFLVLLTIFLFVPCDASSHQPYGNAVPRSSAKSASNAPINVLDDSNSDSSESDENDGGNASPKMAVALVPLAMPKPQRGNSAERKLAAAAVAVAAANKTPKVVAPNVVDESMSDEKESDDEAEARNTNGNNVKRPNVDEDESSDDESKMGRQRQKSRIYSSEMAAQRTADRQQQQQQHREESRKTATLSPAIYGAADCSSHCTVSYDRSLADCWSPTLAHYERVLVGLLRRYVTVQTNRAIWLSQHDVTPDFELMAEESLTRLTASAPPPRIRDANKPLDAKQAGFIVVALMDDAERCVRAVIEDGAPAPHAVECPHACERRWDPFMWLFAASALITCILGGSIAAMAITLERREQKFIHLEIEESSTERKRAASNPTTLNNDGNRSGSDSDCGDGRMSESRVSTALDNKGQKRRRSGGHSHGSSNAHRRRTAMPTIDETVS